MAEVEKKPEESKDTEMTEERKDDTEMAEEREDDCDMAKKEEEREESEERVQEENTKAVKRSRNECIKKNEVVVTPRAIERPMRDRNSVERYTAPGSARSTPKALSIQKEVVLDTIMEFVKVDNGGKYHSSIYHRLIQSIVESSMEIDILLDFLATKFFKYVDVRYFTYINVEKLARTLEVKDINDGNNSSQKGSVELSIRKMYHIVSHIPPLEGVDEKTDYEMWNGLGDLSFPVF